ncbi:hypothetical protein [uncultured Kordia sp.]|uniref:hypothetical protein n=1 Tax=uncultured Kordia sp. TaxID=507699 RepID=UPI0026301337|nr:hypothetical protein [uncultured Kordia sp.]
MKENKIIGFELDEESYKNRVYIKADFDTKELFPEKNHIDYLKEFLLTEKNYDKVMNAFNEYKTKSLPKDIKTNCKFCKGESEKEIDKDCSRYYDQMAITFIMASSEFINIVLRHKYIHDNKKQLFKLTINFFNCFSFITGKGLMYFDLAKMIKFSLSAGFLSLTEMFSKSSGLHSLSVINTTLDSLQEDEIQNKLLEKEDHNHLDLQIEFFEKKKGIYETKVFIEKEKKQQEIQNKKETFSVLEWATIFYYANETKLLPNSRTKKNKKIKFLKKHNISTTYDNLKTKYYEAKKRINEKNDYPIDKLHTIIPFLKEHYSLAVTKVENDILYLKSEINDY